MLVTKRQSSNRKRKTGGKYLYFSPLKGATNNHCISATEIPVVQRTERCILLLKEKHKFHKISEISHA